MAAPPSPPRDRSPLLASGPSRRPHVPDLVLEIGTEELPARAIAPAVAQLRDAVSRQLRAHRLTHGAATTFATPRRLALLLRDVPIRQPDATLEIPGPPVAIAYDRAGRPTRAAIGFARRIGVDLAALAIRDATVWARKPDPGQPAVQVLARSLPRAIGELDFPKTMRWEATGFRFARPIRWLVCLLGAEGVPLTVAGVAADRRTRGHRVLAPGLHRVPTAAEYERVLCAAGVMLDPEERRAHLVAAGEALARAVGCRVVWDADLLAEVVYQVEWPTPLLGAFSAEYLALPAPILATVLRRHQRYFALVDAAGAPVARFLAVRDGDGRGLDTIRAGHERAPARRLADAAAAEAEDRRTPLAEPRERLRGVTYFAGLGTLYDRTLRLEALAEWLCNRLGRADAIALARRAAGLAKADLASRLVAELPELQGIAGGLAAEREGEPVATAIAEHYRPRSPGDSLPATFLGRVVALADRLDLLTAAFLVGKAPTGSEDPLGLRRTAHGVIALLAEWPPLSHEAAVATALRLFADQGLPESQAIAPDAARIALLRFLEGRLAAWLGERGVPPDFVAAALAVGSDPLATTVARAEFLRGWARDDPEGLRAVTLAATRVRNLVRPTDPLPPTGDLDRLVHPAELTLRTIAEERLDSWHQMAARGDWHCLARDWRPLAAAIARFFAEVLVRVDDPDLRASRLTLLRQFDGVFRTLADFAQLTPP